MVTYLNYSNSSNVTGFSTAWDYSAGVVSTATGNSDMFGVMVLGVIFMGFWIVGSKYTQERALMYSSFMTALVAFILVSGNFLGQQYLLVAIVGVILAILFGNRLG